MEERLVGNPGYLIDQNFYTVENTREDSITDDSYFTQWEREKPDQFNVDEREGQPNSTIPTNGEQTPIGPIHQKHKNEE
jgi:hypothetical protein